VGWIEVASRQGRVANDYADLIPGVEMVLYDFELILEGGAPTGVGGDYENFHLHPSK
jgi:hypothetical protein